MTQRTDTKGLRGKEKADHIWTYYKPQIFLALLLVFIAGSVVRHLVTRKEIVLYIGIVNIAASEELMEEIRTDFLAYACPEEKRTDIEILNALYLKEDPSAEETDYVRASEVKFLGSVTAGKMDAVIADAAGMALLKQGEWIEEETVTPVRSAAFTAHGITDEIFYATIVTSTRKETARQFIASLTNE